MAGPGVDERAFNTLRQIRAENDGVTLQAFKQTLREQYFGLVLDPDGALAALPKMLPPDAASRKRILAAIHRTVEAAGSVTGERAQRLAQIEQIFEPGRPTVAARKVPHKARRLAKA
jgi:hypothetical protein